MKASKFSEGQIAFVLKQAEGDVPIGAVCRKAGISDATFYNWRKFITIFQPCVFSLPLDCPSSTQKPWFKVNYFLGDDHNDTSDV